MGTQRYMYQLCNCLTHTLHNFHVAKCIPGHPNNTLAERATMSCDKELEELKVGLRKEYLIIEALNLSFRYSTHLSIDKQQFFVKQEHFKFDIFFSSTHWPWPPKLQNITFSPQNLTCNNQIINKQNFNAVYDPFLRSLLWHFFLYFGTFYRQEHNLSI